MGKLSVDVPDCMTGDGKRSGVEGLYGPWLVTNRIGPFSRASRKKEAPGSGARKKPVISPPSPGLTGDTQATAASPVDLDGWQKPSKVARRRTPEKDVSAASAGVTMGETSQLGSRSKLEAESGAGSDSSRAAPYQGRSEVRPSSSDGLRRGGPGLSPLKRSRSPTRIQSGEGSIGGPLRPKGGKMPSFAKGGRPVLRRRSKSSPPPLAPVHGRPPRAEHPVVPGGGSSRHGVEEPHGRRLLRALSVAAGLSEQAPAATLGPSPVEAAARRVDGDGGFDAGREKEVSSSSPDSISCHMARLNSPSPIVLNKGKGKLVDSMEENNPDDGGRELGESVACGTGSMGTVDHMAQGNSGGQHLQIFLQMMASAKGVNRESQGIEERMVVDTGGSISTGDAGCAVSSGDL
ncbi:uncharacterized protein LOC120104338 [Phoenix dactylifera]|uniref:Uncharacterized protein LOC120104338 n=1 Tax=Phoenix dactylifera TaxID=42345 RepID=A0A8B8ZAU0_PHODC|nr:uncharacterized protein LOC120104338 [Phoenix dactylifera]